MTPLIFFGSDQYSAIVLNQLMVNGQPACRRGRWSMINIITDHKTGGTDVEKLALKHNLHVAYYPDFDHSLITKNTLGLCASFDHLIPQEIIEKFDGNLYNLHPSILPQYRNVSPVQYAIALGDKVTGITLFRVSPTIDDGEIISQIEEPILPTDTTPTLTSRLFKKGAELLLQGYEPCKQTINKVRNLVFTKRLTRDSGFIEWPVLHQLLTNQPISSSTTNQLLSLRLSRTHIIIHHSSFIIHDLLRALTPWPGVWSLVPTKKGEQRISLIYNLQSTISILISGKPAPISLSDFTKYYL